MSQNEYLDISYDLKKVAKYCPPISEGKVVKVYDGDTFKVLMN